MNGSYDVARSRAEIDDALNSCVEAEATGRSRYPGMSYEEGVRAGIEWALGLSEDPPFEGDEDE